MLKEGYDHFELSRLPAQDGWAAYPLIWQCVNSLLGSFKVWNVATVAGNICMALPAGPMTSGLSNTAKSKVREQAAQGLVGRTELLQGFVSSRTRRRFKAFLAVSYTHLTLPTTGLV